jgi:hypothetical protein
VRKREPHEALTDGGHEPHNQERYERIAGLGVAISEATGVPGAAR